MINISIVKENNFISKVTIEGHSGYASSGHDIVCASISSIAITTVNAIARISSEILEFDEKDGFLVMVIKKEDRIINILMENMVSLFKELEEDYPKNIKTTFN